MNDYFSSSQFKLWWVLPLGILVVLDVLLDCALVAVKRRILVGNALLRVLVAFVLRQIRTALADLMPLSLV